MKSIFDLILESASLTRSIRRGPRADEQVTPFKRRMTKILVAVFGVGGGACLLVYGVWLGMEQAFNDWWVITVVGLVLLCGNLVLLRSRNAQVGHRERRKAGNGSPGLLDEGDS